jgi:hypothetical protein
LTILFPGALRETKVKIISDIRIRALARLLFQFIAVNIKYCPVTPTPNTASNKLPHLAPKKSPQRFRATFLLRSLVRCHNIRRASAGGEYLEAQFVGSQVDQALRQISKLNQTKSF